MKILELSNNKKKRRMNSTRQIAFSFFMVILVGSILLSLPICNKQAAIPYLDHLFIATSATCVTGLVTVIPGEQYNILGQIVILLMIQIGGLGFLTFLTLLIVKIKKRLSLSNRMLVQEAFNQKSLENMGHFTKKVIQYTFMIEMFGAFCLAFVFVPDYGWYKGIYYSIFHSISAFCNAGFDVLGDSSLVAYQTNPIITLVIPGLIIMGGLGFIVWFDCLDKFKKWKENKTRFHLKKYFYSLSLHSKLVLAMTFCLLVSGTIIFYLLEFQNPNTIGKLPFVDQIQVSYFTSASLRTAGFSTFFMEYMHPATKMISSIFMFIGGSPCGTAGGIKTVTFALMLLMIYHTYKGNSEVVVWNRRIKKRIIIRSFSLVVISLSIAFTGLFFLSIIEQAPFIDLVFEVFSAFATVGLSAGVTSTLSMLSKMIIIVLMYIGRIGPITMVILFAKKRLQNTGNEIQYPNEDILVG